MRYAPYAEVLSRCYSAVLMDVMDTLGARGQAMSPDIRPLLPAMRCWGEAVTMRSVAVN
ncbi:MAG: hypothetical protein GX657_05405, partial [Chloroflexi bacterium]|nr:hypothetical protein [Chloroflexota bacterium]